MKYFGKIYFSDDSDASIFIIYIYFYYLYLINKTKEISVYVIKKIK